MKTAAAVVLAATVAAVIAYIVIVQHWIGTTIARESLALGTKTLGPYELQPAQNPFRVNVTVYYRAPFVFSTTYTCEAVLRGPQGAGVWRGMSRLTASSSARRSGRRRGGGVTIRISGRRARQSVSSSMGVFRISRAGSYTLDCRLDGKPELFRDADLRLIANAGTVKPLIVILIGGAGGVVALILFLIGMGRGSGRGTVPPESRTSRPVVEARPVE